MSLILMLSQTLHGMTIAEKKQSLLVNTHDAHPYFQEELDSINSSLWEKKTALKNLYKDAQYYFIHRIDKKELNRLIQKIKLLREEIAEIQKMWLEDNRFSMSLEDYALWHAPEATLDELIMEYGTNAIYLIPPAIGAINISVYSNLAIPIESWEEVLHLILVQNGVGVKDVSPYVKELYLLSDVREGFSLITSNLSELELLPSHANICFVLSPKKIDAKKTLLLLQKFSSPISMVLEMIGSQIFIISTPSSIKELLKLYTFVEEGGGSSDYQLVTLSRFDPKEMAQMITTAFQIEDSKNGKGRSSEEVSLHVLPLDHSTPSLFLSGTKEEVRKAKEMISNLEDQVQDPKEKTIFWYTAKYSEAKDLAEVLGKVYGLLALQTPLDASSEESQEIKKNSELRVQPSFIEPGKSDNVHLTSLKDNHIVVDPKSGSLIMVVEVSLLPKIKELLKKLDVPKKMVQIEVLLFEKRMTNKSHFGINLLRLGSAAANHHLTSLAWDPHAIGSGILEFLISRKKESGIPAYDLAYNFLLGQEDIQINASPSITTVNQTPATIAIVEEISINNGAYEIDGSSKAAIKDSYQRAQYGITMQITPTINFGDDENQSGDEGIAYITLDTDITFDTTKNNSANRPDVTRRHIKNHVRIADGQTVILGGLRRKNSEDNKESIPFLGELPGIGKLFSNSGVSDSNTEMFIFITPKIISDPLEEGEHLKQELLKKRPGDLPEFLVQLQEAKNHQKKKLFEKSFVTLFGKKEILSQTGYDDEKEYEGRS